MHAPTMALPGVMFTLREVRCQPKPPTVDEIYEFIKTLFNKAQLSSECSLVCLIYVERLMETAHVPLLASTWKPVLLCGLLLASKVHKRPEGGGAACVVVVCTFGPRAGLADHT